jgi:plastocyanin
MKYRGVFLYLVALILSLHATRAGTITGTVTAQGKTGAEQAAAGGNYESRKFKFVDRINYSEIHDFVVYIDGPMTNHVVAPGTTRKVLTQKDAMFHPHILPICVGTTVEWPNEDGIFHNVFSVSEPKSFDLGLYKSEGKNAEVKRVPFDKTGRVDVFCSIHSDMHCVVLVLENTFFASTDSKGRYTLNDVPPGTYKLRAWHERLPPQTKVVTVTGTGELKVDFTLGIKDLPKY